MIQQYGKYLNDNLIDFGLYDIFDKTSEKVSQTFYLFSTQFYTNLTSRKKLHESALLNKTEAARQHWNVRRWTRNIDIFGKRKILLFPVIEVDPCPHWYLIMVLIPDTRQDNDLLPFIAVLDSVGGKRDVEVVNLTCICFMFDVVFIFGIVYIH